MSTSRWFKRSHKGPVSYDPPPGPPPNAAVAPPQWTAAAEPSHDWGLKNEASTTEYETAEMFCAENPPESARFLDSHIVDRIRAEGAAVWRIEQHPDPTRFRGSVHCDAAGTSHIATRADCQDCCLLSSLPLLAGHYTRPPGQTGVYYEITVDRMDADATVALGSACRPYPPWRLPGWNRLSAALHLDDMRKFFEDPDGGRDYTGSHGFLQRLQPGDVFGFGYEFATGAIFFTRNGGRLPPAFVGEYMQARIDEPGPDVYAAVGVSGCTEVHVNFGAEPFRWKEANTPSWRVERHVGVLGGGSAALDELPAYSVA